MPLETNRSGVRLIIGGFLMLTSLYGCKKEQPPAPRPQARTRVFVHRPFDKLLTCRARITFPKGDTVILEGDETSKEFEVGDSFREMSGEGIYDRKAVGIKVELFGPDGWIIGDNTGASISAHADGEAPLETSFSIVCPNPVHLMVDNRDGTACEIKVGQLKIPSGTNTSGQFGFPAPTSAEACVVQIGGEKVGDLKMSAAGVYLIDVSAHRSYRCQDVVYASSQDDEERTQPTPAQTYSNHRLYEIGSEVEDFLVPAPNVVEVSRAVTWKVRRTQLLEVK